jgi:hypothetical protein
MIGCGPRLTESQVVLRYGSCDTRFRSASRFAFGRAGAFGSDRAALCWRAGAALSFAQIDSNLKGALNFLLCFSGTDVSG